MIPWIGAFFLIISLAVLIRLFGLAVRAGEVVVISRRSFGAIRSSDLSDDDKEAALQKDAKRLLGLFLVLAAGGAAAVLFPTGLLWLAGQLGWIFGVDDFNMGQPRKVSTLSDSHGARQ